MVESTHLFSKEAEDNKYVTNITNMYSENFLKRLYKTIKQFISSNPIGLFYTKSIQRVLGHSRGTKRYLSTKRAVERNCKDTKAIWALKAPGHSNTGT